MACNMKICCQCKHNIQGVANRTQYPRCQEKGYSFEVNGNVKLVVDKLNKKSKKREMK